jgi:hypothetical protein
VTSWKRRLLHLLSLIVVSATLASPIFANNDNPQGNVINITSAPKPHSAPEIAAAPLANALLVLAGGTSMILSRKRRK